MGEAGIFHPEARLELIEGEILEMSPGGYRTVFSRARGEQLAAASIPDAAFLIGS